MNRQYSIRPVLKSGECLSSYLLRLCKSNSVGIRELIKLTSDKKKVNPYYYLLDMLPMRIVNKKKLIKLIGITNEQLHLMTMSNLVRKVCEEVSEDNSDVLCYKVSNSFIKNTRRFCPICLKKNKYFKLIWQMNNVEMCEIHNIKLKDFCGNCGKKLKYVTMELIDFKCNHCKGSIYSNFKDIVYEENIKQKRLIEIYKDLLFNKENTLTNIIPNFSKEQSLLIHLLYLAQKKSYNFNLKEDSLISRLYLKHYRNYINGDLNTTSLTISKMVDIIFHSNSNLHSLKNLVVPESYIKSLIKTRKSKYFEFGVCLSPWCKEYGKTNGMVLVSNYSSKSPKFKKICLCKSCSLRFGVDVNSGEWREITGMLDLITNFLVPKLKESKIKQNILKESKRIGIWRLDDAIGYMGNHKNLKVLVEHHLNSISGSESINSWFKKSINSIGVGKTALWKAGVEKFGWTQPQFFYYYWNPNVQIYLHTELSWKYKREKKEDPFLKETIEQLKETIEQLKEANKPISLITLAKEMGLSVNALQRLGISNEVKQVKRYQIEDIKKEEKEKLKLKIMEFLLESDKLKREITCKDVYRNLGKAQSYIYYSFPDLAKSISLEVIKMKENRKLELIEDIKSVINQLHHQNKKITIKEVSSCLNLKKGKHKIISQVINGSV